MIYVFDVDGTLTPSRDKIDLEFSTWFKSFCNNQQVYLVTGSDRRRTLEQIGEEIYNKCKGVYQCSGNELWIEDELIRTKNINFPKEVYTALDSILELSYFKIRTGNHLDIRSGQANFSVLGRGATKNQRSLYVDWDTETNERKTIAKLMNAAFGKNFEFTVAGETGIDITEKGMGKEQILLDFPDDNVIFFGDKIVSYGNDYSLANATQYHNDSMAINVKDWKDTWQILKDRTE